MLRFLPLCLLAAAASAQPLDFERQITPFPVLDADGDPYDLAFAGAFNNPRTQLADPDGDGTFGLFILEEQGRISHYEHTGALDFAWRSDQYAGIDAGSWFRFGDLDGDGDEDLITQRPSGQVRYWENGGGSAPSFTLGADPLLDLAGDPVAPEDPNVPALADVDGDGDLDLFLGRADSGKIRWYRHTGAEGGVPQYELAGEQFQDIVIFESNPTCGDDPTQPLYITPGAPAPGSSRGSLHGQNALTFADPDGDGDLDLFWGDFFTPSLYFFENTGSAAEPGLEFISEQYPLDNPLTSAGYNVPSFRDLDGDGDLDLVIGIVGGFCSTTANIIDNLYYLENTGTPTAPDYREQTSRLLDAVDVGRASYPAAEDLDGDGDLDLLVGSGFNPGAPARGSFFRFENTGTPAAPQFRLAEDDFLSLDVDFANHYAPAFGDLDGDGRRDLLVGTFGGRMAFLLNTGGGFELTVEALQDLDVGSTATPTLGDLDGDGDLDLLVGEFSGTLNYFRNDGSVQLPNFVEATLPGLFDVSDPEDPESIDVGRYSAPHLADVDRDGDLDLFLGTERDDVLFYRNTGSPEAPAFEVQPFDVGALRYNTSPTAADLDGDGDLDLLAGDLAGGLLYLDNRQITTSSALPPAAPGRARLQTFPNPFGADTTLRVGASREPMTLAVFDAAGREVRRWALGPHEAAQSVSWDGTMASGTPVPSGLYVARLTAGDRLLGTQKLTRLRQ
ncbi:MAG: FG-GAP-like repeat-containing protein [Bacteroidota bacterium]